MEEKDPAEEPRRAMASVPLKVGTGKERNGGESFPQGSIPADSPSFLSSRIPGKETFPAMMEKGGEFFYLASVCYTSGRRKEAEAFYRLAAEADPNDSAVFNNLGVVLRDQGDLEGAARCLRKAVRNDPANARAYYNLGNVLNDQGKKEGARRCYQKAFDLDPAEATFHKALGNILRELGRKEEARSLFADALRRFPDDAEVHCGMGAVLQDLGRLEESAASYRQALGKKPDAAEIHYNLGNVYLKLDLLDAAEASFQEAITLRPDFAEAYNNLGTTYKEMNAIERAVRMFEKAIELKGDFAEARWNLGLAHLLGGDFGKGWKGYEWRWEKADYKPFQRTFSSPLWRGEELSGRTILLYAEQGFGDAIQFVRYVPLVAERKAHVLLECPKELKSLFASVSGALAVIGRGERLPPFDYHCPLMSLPNLLGTELDTIPKKVPYLFPEKGSVERWKEKMPVGGGWIKTGLVWAGNPDHLNDRHRSCSPADIQRLFDMDGVLFYNLQLGRQWEKDPLAGEKWIDWTPRIRDFADTAALIANLDLVISVDTAVAHLAGAMGKRVWTLLPYSPDWRWLLDRDDSPWYPTMRLYRQPRPGDWSSVWDRVKRDLRALSFSGNG